MKQLENNPKIIKLHEKCSTNVHFAGKFFPSKTFSMCAKSNKKNSHLLPSTSHLLKAGGKHACHLQQAVGSMLPTSEKSSREDGGAGTHTHKYTPKLWLDLC
jgi:hypothetical protein